MLHKTIKRYVGEAYQVLANLGYQILHPKASGCFAILRGIPYPDKGKATPKLSFTSITWDVVLTWSRRMIMPRKIDTIAFTIIALAFTTIGRVGTFIPKSKKAASTFS